MLWVQSQKMGVTPSHLMGLEAGTFDAYCFDQALWYLGTTIEYEMEKASHKPSKGERQAQASRKRILDKYLDDGTAKDRFADPSLLFQ